MTYEEWKKQAIEQIDDLVEDVINDNQGNPDFEENEERLIKMAISVY